MGVMIVVVLSALCLGFGAGVCAMIIAMRTML